MKSQLLSAWLLTVLKNNGCCCPTVIFLIHKPHENPQDHPQLEILETLLTRPLLDESAFLSLPQPSVGLGAIVPPKQSSLNERPTSCFVYGCHGSHR